MRMCVLFSLMIMLILAVGSCKEYMEVEAIEGGNASLPFTAVGLTIFCEIDCEKRTMITKIGRYCGPDENCTTDLSTPFSIETGSLIVRNVTSNRCFSAELIQGTGNIKTFYNVTTNKLLHSTISAEIPTTTFTTEPPDYTSTDSYNNTASFSAPRVVDVVFVVVVFVVVVAAPAAVVVVILVAIVLLADQYKCKQRYVNANAAAGVMLEKVSHEEIIMEKLESANRLLTTVDETQL